MINTPVVVIALISVGAVARWARWFVQRRAEDRMMNRLSAKLNMPGFRYRSHEEAVAVIRFVQRRDYDAALKILETERDYT